ncbi:MAG: carboxypeptidase-like regulatory domain-containing protein, partial [Oscillospiraceae bacterium]|nr:carboxypeptidase-like regulatory domain-containing protein [Oscillospiraceae bacterium]
DYTTKVTANGYGDLTGTLTVKDNPTTYNAELSRCVVNVGGIVTDKDTKLPISNATVTLTDKDGNTLTANTNSIGIYTINNVPTGDYTTKVTANGYDDLTGNLTVKDNPTTYNAELNRTMVNVGGLVTDKNTGLPIPNATVTLTDKDGNTLTANTNSLGIYTINNVPTGDYTTKVTANGYNDLTGTLTVKDNPTTYNAELNRTMVNVGGLVTDKNTGLPIPNATVTLTDKDGNTLTANTNSLGIYTINNVPTGDYTTKVTANGYDDLTGTLTVKDNPTTYNAELNRTMVNVGGLVTDKNTGLPIPNATVTLTDKDGNTLTANTNSLGIYSINNVPTGDYTTKVTADGYVDVTGTVSVQSNTTYNAQMERKIVSITGIVTDKDTKLPIEGATVSITANGQTFTATTDQSGAYSINNIPTGNYLTKVSAEGYTDVTGNIVVIDNSTYNAELSRKIVTVTGIVTDKNTNTRITNATVVLTNSAYPSLTYTTTTNSSGQYTINNVVTGDYTTKVTASGYSEVNETLKVIDNTTYNVQLVKLFTLSGTVTNKNSGTPINGVSITIESNGKTYTATTDLSGFYSISNVEPGDWNITATANKYGDYTNTITIVSDTTHNIQMSINIVN